MKMGYLAIIALLQASSALADSYLFSVVDRDPGKIVLAKNCLDYTFCSGKASRLSGDAKSGYRLNAYIDLSDSELKVAMNSCNFAKLGLEMKVIDLNKGSSVSVPQDNGLDYQEKIQTISVLEISPSQKILKYDRIKKLIDDKNHIGAINAVINEYNLFTGGYQLLLAGDMGKAGAVTDHVAKTVTFSNTVFWDPCVLIKIVRHELEHVLQFAQVYSCAKKGKRHNMLDHYTRERSAYMNDIRNIPNFCPNALVRDSLVSQFTQFFLDDYFKNQ